MEVRLFKDEIDEVADQFNENYISVNKYLPNSDRNVVVYHIDLNDSIESIIDSIMNLDLPNDYDDLLEKEEAVADLQVKLVQLQQALINKGYMQDINDLYLLFKYFNLDHYTYFDLSDLNAIQRNLLNIIESVEQSVSNIVNKKLHHYENYTKDLGDSFADLVNADMKLILHYLSYIK